MAQLDDVETVGVVGAGTMGSGIAQAAATAGYDVILSDVSQELLAAGMDRIDDSLSRLVDRDDLPEGAADGATDRITTTTAKADLSAVDVAVEAVIESLEVKQEVFGELDEICPAGATLATNTSTLSVTSIADATERPEAVVGLHFMNPVPMMPGVEVVVGEHTPQETVTLAHEFAESLGKETWEADDKPGFVVNRILMPWINEGIRAFDEGVATKTDIDSGMRLGTNVPMGPLELADHVGLDVVLAASKTLHEELGDRFRPAYLLRRKVAAGDLGKKTGRGFYDYE
jgi:3-hydroxybutyryl-CoA dehydrogenase